MSSISYFFYGFGIGLFGGLIGILLAFTLYTLGAALFKRRKWPAEDGRARHVKNYTSPEDRNIAS